MSLRGVLATVLGRPWTPTYHPNGEEDLWAFTKDRWPWSPEGRVGWVATMP